MNIKTHFFKRTIAFIVSVATVISVCTYPISAVADDTAQNTSWDLTEIYADVEAYKKDVDYYTGTLIPEYKSAADNITDVASLLKLMQLRDKVCVFFDKIWMYQGTTSALDCLNKDCDTISSYYAKAFNVYNQADIYITQKVFSVDNELLQRAITDDSLAIYRKLLLDESVAFEGLTPEEEEKAKEESEWLETTNNKIIELSDKYKQHVYGGMQFPTVTLTDGTEIIADDSACNLMDSLSEEDAEIIRTGYISAFRKDRDFFAENMNEYYKLEDQCAQSEGYESTFDKTMKLDDFTKEGYNVLLKGVGEYFDNQSDYNTQELPQVSEIINPTPSYTYEQAQQIVINSTAILGSNYTDILKKGFNEKWLDVYPKTNKDTGGVTIACTSLHPFVLINYDEGYDGLNALSHEMGHALHDCLSIEAQPLYDEKYPALLVCEVASTTNEMLLSSYLQKNASTDREKLYFLLKEIDYFEGSLFSTVQYADFERSAREIVEKGGTLTADKLDELFVNSMNKYSTEKYDVENNGPLWALVSHFYLDYYVYKYSVAAAAAYSISEKILANDQEAISNYRKLLSSGSSLSVADTYKLIGVDINSTEYLQPALNGINDLKRQALELYDKIQQDEKAKETTVTTDVSSTGAVTTTTGLQGGSESTVTSVSTSVSTTQTDAVTTSAKKTGVQTTSTKKTQNSKSTTSSPKTGESTTSLVVEIIAIAASTIFVTRKKK